MKKKIIGIAGVFLVAGFLLGWFLCCGVSAGTHDYVEGSALAAEWILNSGECTAERYQAYAAATDALEELGAAREGEKPKAVVLDIDETVLNNYDFIAEIYLNGKGYSDEAFQAWVAEGKAVPIEGAAEFLQRADELGFEIFYVTNRLFEHADVTVENLKKYGLPNADREYIFLKEEHSDKQERFDRIGEQYDIVMYVGDTLNDFPIDTYRESNGERRSIVTENSEEFGVKYIMIPNPSYGSFEEASYGYEYSLGYPEKAQLRYEEIEEAARRIAEEAGV